MTRIQWFAASFLVLAGSVTFMLVFAYTAQLTYEVSFQGERFAEDSEIAGIDVSDMTRDEAVDAVRENVEGWQEETHLHLTWFDEEIPVPRESIQFLIEPTVDRRLDDPDASDEGVITAVDQGAVRQSAESFSFREDMRTAVDIDDLTDDIERETASLPDDDLQWMMHGYLNASAQPEEVVIAEASRSNVVTPELQEALDGVTSETIEGGTSFSVMEQLSTPSEDWVDEEPLAALGSAVFEVVASSNFNIEERHHRYALLDSVPMGFDAHLEEDIRDFQFTNPNDYDYELEFNLTGTNLEVTLVGYEFPYDIAVDVFETDNIGTRTKITYSQTQETEDSTTELDNGENGLRVETIRTLSYQDAELDDEPIGQQVLAEDYYAPVHALERRSIDQRQEEEEDEDEDDFPWFDEDFNGFNDEEERDEFEDWLENGEGSDAFEDWLDEGAPGDFDDWLEENGDNGGFDFDNGNGFDFDNGNGADNGFDFDTGNGADNGFDFDTGNGADNGFDFDTGNGADNGLDFDNGNGDDNGFDFGNGNGNGSSPGNGNGTDNGFGPGNGNGNGNGFGPGTGNGNGNGAGPGNGNGNGTFPGGGDPGGKDGSSTKGD
ncbi:VanW family protein [Alkalicoccus chagannorensis]|uniref:VanW family protein n=1 Tax=Alkalicoccus chagannorensis TaxID=427072 RepID=UPI000409B4F6|nr:VanW family protein [Alkalicoccus chagannorensis]